jgi:hypothetical protein
VVAPLRGHLDDALVFSLTLEVLARESPSSALFGRPEGLNFGHCAFEFVLKPHFFRRLPILFLTREGCDRRIPSRKLLSLRLLQTKCVNAQIFERSPLASTY